MRPTVNQTADDYLLAQYLSFHHAHGEHEIPFLVHRLNDRPMHEQDHADDTTANLDVAQHPFAQASP